MQVDDVRFAGIEDLDAGLLMLLQPRLILSPVVASDFDDYWRAQRAVDAAYADVAAWGRMAALNTARSGWFSSDRTIRSYNADIWRAASLTE